MCPADHGTYLTDVGSSEGELQSSKGESSDVALPRKDLLVGEEFRVTRHQLRISRLCVYLMIDTWVYNQCLDTPHSYLTEQRLREHISDQGAQMCVCV